jgi:hypothetical protein
MANSNKVEVNEKRRAIYFKDGSIGNFHNVKWFDASGSWLRMESDEGYIIANPENINYIKVGADERVV